MEEEEAFEGEDGWRQTGEREERKVSSGTNRSEVEGEKEANTLSKVDYGGVREDQDSVCSSTRV